MNDRIRAVDCPSCGAPLELPIKRQRLFKCNFCGTTLEDLSTPKEQETGQHPKVIIHSTATTRTVPSSSRQFTAASTPSSNRSGCIVFFIILFIVSIAVFVPLVASGVIDLSGTSLADEIASTQIYSFGFTRLLPSDNDTQPDIAGVTSNSDDTDRMVYVDFEADPQLRWRSEPLGEGSTYSYNHLVANNLAIYLAYKTTLVAFDRADGSILWQQELSDEVSHICKDCLQIFDAQVVTLNADGMLNGFDAQSGDSLWTVRLNETTRLLMNLNGNAGVLDKEDDAVGIQVYDPTSGELIQRIVPSCPNEVFSSPQTLGVYDDVLVSSDHQKLYVPISNYDPGCLQTWDAATLTTSWEASIPRDILDNISWDPYLFTDKTLFVTDGHNLFAINLLDGNYWQIYNDEDHDLIPLVEQDGILLARAERTRGTRQYYLWAFDIEAPSKLWEFNPVAEEIIEDGSDVIYQEGNWTVNAAPDKTIVLEAFSEPGVITFTTLDIQDGTEIGKNSLQNITDYDSTYWMEVTGWKGETVYLEIDANLKWIDALTGTEKAVWP